ncbi:MAG: arsenite methyltransferase [Bacteroidetes bacterium]|nr:arsenite methyltransferase [Bacteroidota bacterium]
MRTNEQVKEMVKQKYSEIALQDKASNASSCCGATSSCCGDEVYSIMSDDYTALKGYNPDADLALGCGLPTEFAKIKKGDVVIDLGSGAGNDCFIARHECGAEGKVIGIDFTDAMINKARTNAEKLGFNNVEFRQGDIEKLPVGGNMADVIVSNCVLNLVPDKEKVFKEMIRVLKPGGHFSVSDIVLVGQLPDKWKETAEMYAGCVSGAIQKSDYIGFAKQAGFKNLTIQKEKIITIPEDILERYFSKEEIANYKNSGTGIYSITLYGEKPETCCEPGCCD